MRMQARGFQWVSQLPWKNKVKCVYECILNRTCNLNGYFLFSCSFVLLCLEIVQKSNLGKAWQMQPRGFQWTVAFSKHRKLKYLILARICKLSPKVAFSKLQNATKAISTDGCNFKTPKNKNDSFQLGSASCHPKLHFRISKMQPRGFQGRGLIRFQKCNQWGCRQEDFNGCHSCLEKTRWNGFINVF